MTARLEKIFRIWFLLIPLGVLLVAVSVIHIVFRVSDPVIFLLPNDPTAWLLLGTGILLLLAGSSRGFKAGVMQLVRRFLTWMQRRKNRH
jgi:hypothetical protein